VLVYIYRSRYRFNRLNEIKPPKLPPLSYFMQIPDLRSGQEYRVRVRALNTCGWGPWTDAVLGSTAPDVPGPPESPTVSFRSGTSLRISWEVPSKENGAAIESYEVQMAQEPSDFATIFSGAETSCKAFPLNFNTSYTFRVRAINEVGAGMWSGSTRVTTSLAPPLEPRNLTATSSQRDCGSVILAWDPPKQDSGHAHCTAFEIEATAKRLGPRAATSDTKPVIIKQTCSGKVSEHRMTGLRLGAEYSIRMRGIGLDGAGHGPWSTHATVSLYDVSAREAIVPCTTTSEEEETVVRNQRQRKSLWLAVMFLKTCLEEGLPEAMF